MLENGIFLGSQILVPGMPLLIEMVILFDLLIVVACFGVLVSYLLTHVGTTSTLELEEAGRMMRRRAASRARARAARGGRWVAWCVRAARGSARRST